MVIHLNSVFWFISFDTWPPNVLDVIWVKGCMLKSALTSLSSTIMQELQLLQSEITSLAWTTRLTNSVRMAFARVQTFESAHSTELTILSGISQKQPACPPACGVACNACSNLHWSIGLCLTIFSVFIITTEKINGAANVAAPCNNVNHNKPTGIFVLARGFDFSSLHFQSFRM